MFDERMIQLGLFFTGIIFSYKNSYFFKVLFKMWF